MIITPEIKRAFQHVQEFHPQVCILIFTTDIRWRYLDIEFNAPVFGEEIDTSILEEAIDTWNVFPAIFEYSELCNND